MKKVMIGVIIVLIVVAVIVVVLFEYNYGSFHGGERNYKIYAENGNTYISAKGLNGINLDLEKEIEENILNDISKIIVENKIYERDGFDKRSNDTDGKSFNLKVKYANGMDI